MGYLSAPVDSYTKLLLHMDGVNNSTTFMDVSGKTVTPNGGAKISTTQSKFNGSSGYFGGAGDYLYLGANTDFDLGYDLTSSFTLDFWFLTTTTLVNATLYSNRYEQPSSGRGAIVHINGTTNDGKIWWRSGSGGPTDYLGLSTTTGGFNDGIWHHVACIRSGSTYKIYVDGILSGSTTWATAPYPGGNACIGRDPYYGSSGQYDYTGYIDELRVSKGIARWTANFTPPTLPYALFRQMGLQEIPNDSTANKMNPIELVNISNRCRIGTESDKKHNYIGA